MLSPTVAPLPPPSSAKPRPRAQTLMSPVPPVDRSPTSNRSYFQPVGAGSLRKNGGSSGHGRSRSQGDAAAGAAAASVGKGKRRAVFCDVVVDELDLAEDGSCLFPPGPAADFLDSLGTPISLPEAGTSSPPAVRPMTPGQTRRVDYDKVRQNLHELWKTEQSYLRKMSSLRDDFAHPLRLFSKKRETAIISAFEANHLFINIEQLVPIAEAFERDLRQLVDEAQRVHTQFPADFGEVILRHIEQMAPYKKWLANVASSEAIRQYLDKNNSSFRQFIERTQQGSRESADTTGGFKEFLAEPFQRISRYRLMLDPMAFYLPPDDPNVAPLQDAAAILTDICSMRVDDATKRAAVFWSLRETIDCFPDTMIDSDREFVGCIDADEIIEVADSRPTTLRCTLFLFNDYLLIAKRPSGDKTGKVCTGLDDIERLLTLYQTSHLSSTQASLLGSPKKLRKGILGFRGLVDLSEVVAVDLGNSSPSSLSSSTSSPTSPEFGLVFDHPPTDQSERWCGRPARKFVVANTYAPDVRRPEKEVWLTKFAETILQGRLRNGARKAVRGKRVWEDGSGLDSTEVYWAVWDRRTWESLPGAQKGKLALQFSKGHEAPAWSATRDGRPVVSARVAFLPDNGCLFEVKSTDSRTSAENIGLDRIAGAIAELGFSYGLFSFPHLRPLTLAERPSRPRSNLLTAALDVFSGSSGLKRQHSMTSKTSSVATTTIASTPNLSASLSPGLGARFSSSCTPTSPRQTPLSQSMRASLSKKSEPNLYASASQRPSGFDRVEEDSYGGMAVDGDVSENALVGSIAPASGRKRRAAGRRSLSLPPPPQARLHATPSPDRAYDDYSPSRSSVAGEVEVEAKEMEVLDPSPLMDAIDEPKWPIAYSSDAPGTSPMGYRPQVGSTRRRMIGPRDMRQPVGDGESSAAHSSPAHLPFAREHSPTPLHHPHISGGSTVTYQSSPAHSKVALVDENSSQPSSSKRTRPLVEMSPRPTPAKKVASVGGAAPRQPSTLQQPPLFPAGRRSSCASVAEQRIPSSSSIGRIHMRSRRVTSGATIRGPPSPPKAAEQADVFSSPGTPAKVERKPAPIADDDPNDMEVDPDIQPPIQRLKEHIDWLRLRLAREVANKENGQVASPTALSRSPHTRNVFAKTLGDPSLSSPSHTFNRSTPFATFSEPRRPTEQNVDLAVLSRWTRKLAELADACEEELAAKPTTPEPMADDGSALEVAMLEQERDLLAADLVAIKEEAGNLVDREQTLRAAVEVSQEENAKLRQAYSEIWNEAEVLFEDFNVKLEGIMQAAQAEPTATGEYIELTTQLHTAVSERYQAEHDLRQYRRQVEAELEEKARWGELLRQHGLMPT
ncbi:hypothetical protein JCM11251_007252 [Rhodosporidiobolus azoricus]